MTLQEIGMKYGTDKATHHKYCDFYEEHFPDRTFSGRLLEIGVMDGASLKMWAEYYPDASIVGVDIDDKRHLLPEMPSNVTIVTADATSHKQMQPLGKFDIIVDDGSHMASDQLMSFCWLYFNQLDADGLYVIEDLHTTLPDHPGSYRDTLISPMSFIKHVLVRSTTEIQEYRRDPDEADSMTAIIWK